MTSLLVREFIGLSHITSFVSCFTQSCLNYMKRSLQWCSFFHFRYLTRWRDQQQFIFLSGTIGMICRNMRLIVAPCDWVFNCGLYATLLNSVLPFTLSCIFNIFFAWVLSYCFMHHKIKFSVMHFCLGPQSFHVAPCSWLLCRSRGLSFEFLSHSSIYDMRLGCDFYILRASSFWNLAHTITSRTSPTTQFWCRLYYWGLFPK